VFVNIHNSESKSCRIRDGYGQYSDLFVDITSFCSFCILIKHEVLQNSKCQVTDWVLPPGGIQDVMK
jgi:hypothetical protein